MNELKLVAVEASFQQLVKHPDGELLPLVLVVEHAVVLAPPRDRQRHAVRRLPVFSEHMHQEAGTGDIYPFAAGTIRDLPVHP